MKKKRKNSGRSSSKTSTRTEVRSPTRTSTSTEVRSPTSTSTDAYTRGNVTVTGGAGKGNTNVSVNQLPSNAPERRGRAGKSQQVIAREQRKAARAPRLHGLFGTGMRRTPAELLDVLAKRAPGGLSANVSRIYLGLKKGCLSENRVRSSCKSRPEMLSVAAARSVLDALTRDAGISGSTDFAGRGVWEGAAEDSVVFESLHVGGGPGLQKFQSKMNAIARTAGQRTCQDAVMVIHQSGGKATVDFISHLGKRAQRHRAC